MTRGSNRECVLSWKRVARLTCLKALVFQLYIVTRSVTTCTIQSLLVAMSLSGGNWAPPVVCPSFGPATCVNKLTPAAEGAAAPGLTGPAPGRAAAAFFAGTANRLETPTNLRLF